MKKWFFIIIPFCVVGLVIFRVLSIKKTFNYAVDNQVKETVSLTPNASSASSGKTVAGEQKKDNQNKLPAKKSFSYSFSPDGVLEESGEIFQSSSPDWSVSSGAYLFSQGGIGKTIQDDLKTNDKWRLLYVKNNPLDTDNGVHPQNIFRLVQRGSWLNFTQEAYFKITADNLSASSNRNNSNGLLFFNRYQDAFNLYYTGIRVDGYATIKKKINGNYYTLVYKRFINGPVYNRDDSSSLLPKDTWIGLRSEVKTESDGTVNIKLYVDNGRTGNWVLVADAKDDGKSFGGAVFSAGHGGIRTDFMDVEFSDYKISEF